MAIFTRINGDAAGQINVDNGRALANATVINTGIAAPLQGYKITFAAGTTGNIAAELCTGGAVETVLRIVSGNATVLAYQVDASTTAGAAQISVITERDGWPSGALATAIQTGANQFTPTIGGNIGATGNIWVSSNSITVNTSRNFKLSAS